MAINLQTKDSQVREESPNGMERNEEVTPMIITINGMNGK